MLDTHTLIWSQDNPSKLPTVAKDALTDPAHDRLLSIVTVWEIGIKVALGKLNLSKPLRGGVAFQSCCVPCSGGFVATANWPAITPPKHAKGQ